MSGVYIKGMEMPKNEPMLVKINPDGSVSTTAKNNYRKYEAIPVPEHGDLIDRDALMEHLGDSEYKGAVKRVLIQAPTIIPADHADKEDGE